MSSSPCPRLERLVTYEPHPDLIRIIRSRIENPHHVTPLRYLTIVGAQSFDKNMISALRKLPILIETKGDHNGDRWVPEWPLMRGPDPEYDLY